MAEEKWVDVGSAEELASNTITPRARGDDADRARPSRRRASARSPASATTSAARSARAASTATTSSARGTTGSSTARTGRGRAGLRGRPRARRTRRRSRTAASSSTPTPRTPRAQEPARAAPAGARRPSARPARCASSGISTTVMDRANPRYSTSEALLDAALAHAARGARRRDAAASASRAQVPRLRGLLLEERARLHLAVLDHPDGPERPARPGLRGARPLGRRHPGRDADPLGRARARSTTRWSSA